MGISFISKNLFWLPKDKEHDPVALKAHTLERC